MAHAALDEEEDLNTQHIGRDTTLRLTTWLQTATVEDTGHLKEIFSKLQNFIIFLIHVNSGQRGELMTWLSSHLSIQQMGRNALQLH